MAEIAVRWGEALLDVQHVRPQRALRTREPLEAPVVIERAGRLCCISPEGARRSLVAGGVYRAHAGVEALRELDSLSGGALVLSDGESARIEVGALTYEVRSTAPVLGAPRSKASRALPLALLGALALHAPLLIALASMPPRVAALGLHHEPLPVALIASLREAEGAKAEAAQRDPPAHDHVPFRDPWGEGERDALFWAPWPYGPDPGATICGPCGFVPFAPAHQHPTPTVGPGRAQVVGALGPESVQRVVGQHLAEVRFCYEQGLEASPDLLQGVVTVRWIIGADGRVMSAAIGSSELRSASVERCIASVVRRWTFPSSEGVTGVGYPFTLQAQ